jgi:hypothetical protein
MKQTGMVAIAIVPWTAKLLNPPRPVQSAAARFGNTKKIPNNTKEQDISFHSDPLFNSALPFSYTHSR